MANLPRLHDGVRKTFLKSPHFLFQNSTRHRVAEVLHINNSTGKLILKWQISPEGLVRDKNGTIIVAKGDQTNPILQHISHGYIDGKTLVELLSIHKETILFKDKNFVYQMNDLIPDKITIISANPERFAQLNGGYYSDGQHIFTSKGILLPGNPKEFKILENGDGMFKENSEDRGLDHASIFSLGEYYFSDDSGRVIYYFEYEPGSVNMGEIVSANAKNFRYVKTFPNDDGKSIAIYTDGKQDYYTLYPILYINRKDGTLIREIQIDGNIVSCSLVPIQDIERLLLSGIITTQMAQTDLRVQLKLELNRKQSKILKEELGKLHATETLFSGTASRRREDSLIQN